MDTNINPNVEVGQEANAESKIGEITSFDQLDRITDDQIRGRKKPKEPEVKTETTKTEAEASPILADTKGKPLGDDDANITPTLGINPETIKPIQLTHGEDKFEVLPTASLPVKVDGEGQTVSLQDLMSNYSGKVAYDKRFNDLNLEKQTFAKERREFTDEKSFVEGKINRFHELSQDDPIAAFDFLCELSGKDPVEFQKTFRDNLSKKFEQYYELDDIGKREFNLQEQERLLDRKRQSDTDRTAQAEQTKAEQLKVQTAIDKYGINQDRYFEVVDEIRKAAPQVTIEPDHVIRYDRALLAQKVVREVRPDKAEDSQILGELAAVLVQNPEFKEDDLKGILAEVWKDVPSQTSKDLSQKVLKTQSQTKPDPKPVVQSELWSFDQV